MSGMRSRWTALILTALVVLAGCSGGSTEKTQPTTITDAAVKAQDDSMPDGAGQAVTDYCHDMKNVSSSEARKTLAYAMFGVEPGGDITLKMDSDIVQRMVAVADKLCSGAS